MDTQSKHGPFLWGASTAAHQVEGGTYNQWTEWEKAQANNLAATAEQRLSWLPYWQRFKKQASDPANYISGQGVDHYHRYKEDFTLLQSLNMNSLRFSIEWSRLEPRPGEWDQQAIQHYREYIAELKSRGITPVVTLWHWTTPVWFAHKGGFERRKNLKYFYRFAQKVIELYGDDLKYVITINEPTVYAHASYVKGEWPPQQKSLIKGALVTWNLAVAHNKTYALLKKQAPHVQIGLAHQLSDARPAKHSLLNRFSIALYEYIANWAFADRVRKRQDFFGLNYYFTEYKDWRGGLCNPKTPTNDLGWFMQPSGIRRLLQKVWTRYGLPVIIVENGLADAADDQRQWWLSETMTALDEARAAGVQLQGYLHWSLLDNFEWAYGWWPEFGLIHVDHTTMKRTVRPSAKWLAERIAEQRQMQ